MQQKQPDERKSLEYRAYQGWYLPLGLVLGGLIGLGLALVLGGSEALVNGLIFGAGFGLVFGLAFSTLARRRTQT